MNAQKFYIPQQSQSLGEFHPVPAGALPTYENCKKVELPRFLTLRTSLIYARQRDQQHLRIVALMGAN